LRYRAIVHTIPRAVTVDTVIGGQEIKAGNVVFAIVFGSVLIGA